jgi:hypothetical protein
MIGWRERPLFGLRLYPRHDWAKADMRKAFMASQGLSLPTHGEAFLRRLCEVEHQVLLERHSK